jgi:hypothetical protein
MWQRRRRLVVVHQHQGPTIEGVLVHRSMDCYRVAKASLLEAEGQTVPLDGEIEVPRERVLFLQLVGRAA